MGQFTTTITNTEPIGFLVYILQNGTKLTMNEFSMKCGANLSELLKLLTEHSGFNPEPPDAIGYFIFEDYANKFADALLSLIP